MADFFADLFASGRIVDLVLALVVLEALALLALRRRRGTGPSPVALIGNLASGACLMLALRAALTGGGWMLIAGFLLASLAAHVLDLALRLRTERVGTPGRGPVSDATGTSPENAAFTARHQAGMISRFQ